MGALEHLRIIEIGNDIMAPFCARLFADMGAEVIKVELPPGDSARRRITRASSRTNDGYSGFFQYLNSGKSCVTADLDDPNDRRLFDELVATADVLVENLPQGKRKAWRLDGPSLGERYPQLIVVSISAYGRSGPWSELEGTDINIQAASALSAALGMSDKYPLRIPYDQAEYQASLHAMAAALCALIERDRSSLGQSIDISATDVMAYQAGAMHLVTRKSGGLWTRAGKQNRSGIFPSGFFECADGHLCVATPHGRIWHQYLKLMGDPEWSHQEHQRDALYLARSQSVQPAHVHFREWLRKHTRAELLELTRNTDIILGVVNKVDELYSSEQMAFRGFWSEVGLGDKNARFPKLGVLMSGTPTKIRSRAPAPCQRIKEETAGGRRLNTTAPDSEAHRGRALEGIRVLDFGWNWAGPMAGQLLGDMGAEVIRVETNKRLDNMRLPAFSEYFCHNNRSKLSATFNLKDPEGVRLIKELVRHSDVVMENFAAGVMAKNGLSYEELREVNPRLVYMSMSMAGETGPLSHMRGFASIATAYAGIEGLMGYPETGDVVGFTSFGLGDTNMAIQGTIGTLGALIHARRTGEGQFVDVSQIESSTATLGEMIMEYALTGGLPDIQGNRHPEYAPHNYFAAKGEDQWVAISVCNDEHWLGLCRAMGRTDLLARDDLSDRDSRRVRVEELETLVADWCGGRGRDEVVAHLREQGVPASPLLSAQERDSHPLFVERMFVHEHRAEGWDDCKIYNTPWKFSDTPPEVTHPAPQVGEHNQYVYRQILKLSDEQVNDLISREVLY
jgi:crotonobetainyl-CoA:carnitine CoA-transferase CaiB-like acyl-CoA transferase